MRAADRDLHVVAAGFHLDPARRSPGELLSAWRDFGAVEQAAASQPGIRMTIVLAGWQNETRQLGQVACEFVRERRPTLLLPGGRTVRRTARDLCARVAALEPDLVHVGGLLFPRDLRALRAALPGTPIVAQDHATKVPAAPRRWYYRWGFAVLDAAMFTAADQADAFKGAGILRGDLPVFEVVEGSSSFMPGDRAAARAATGLAGDPCLFWLGNLKPNKDPLMVLSAVAAAARELPELRLYMAYREAPLVDRVKARIAADPLLAGRVAMLGEIASPKIETYLQAADFLVQGSHAEGSGYGVIEALACGATPLVTDIPSFRRITGSGQFGALAPVGDPAALAREIVAWSRRDRQELRRAARGHFERELSFPAIGRQLRGVYERLSRRR